MTDRHDNEVEETPEEAMDRLRHDLKVTGAPAAYAALLDVCQNPKAPAPAKATAGVALLRAAGMFAKADEDNSLDPSQMTAKQIDQELKRLRRQLKSSTEGDSDDGVFA